MGEAKVFIKLRYAARNSGRGVGGSSGLDDRRRYLTKRRQNERYAGISCGRPVKCGGLTLVQERLCAKCRFWEKKFVKNVEKNDLTFWEGRGIMKAGYRLSRRPAKLGIPAAALNNFIRV